MSVALAANKQSEQTCLRQQVSKHGRKWEIATFSDLEADARLSDRSSAFQRSLVVSTYAVKTRTLHRVRRWLYKQCYEFYALSTGEMSARHHDFSNISSKLSG